MSTFATLLTRYNALPVFSQRAVSAIVGAFVADAATRPTHWVYDTSVLDSTIGDANPEFWPSSLSPFYTIPTGRRSCYSDEALVMLQSLRTHPTTFVPADTATAIQQLFAPGSEYAEALLLRQKAYEPSQRTEKREPIPGPWQQAVITHYLKAVAEGKSNAAEPTSSETDGFCLSLPLVASLSARDENEDFDAAIAFAVGFLTSSESALVHSAVKARILRHLIRTEASVGVPSTASARRTLVGKTVTDYEDELLTAEWETVLRKLPTAEEVAAGESIWGADKPSPAFTAAVKSFGQACPDPGNFQSSLLALVSCESFTEGVRRNLLAGGCNCSRANFLGACLGAAYGLDTANGIPADWVAQTDKGLEVMDMALDLFE